MIDIITFLAGIAIGFIAKEVMNYASQIATVLLPLFAKRKDVINEANKRT